MKRVTHFIEREQKEAERQAKANCRRSVQFHSSACNNQATRRTGLWHRRQSPPAALPRARPTLLSLLERALRAPRLSTESTYFV